MNLGDIGIYKHSGIVNYTKSICFLERNTDMLSYTCIRTRQNGGTEGTLWIKHHLSDDFWDRIVLLWHFWVPTMKPTG